MCTGSLLPFIIGISSIVVMIIFIVIINNDNDYFESGIDFNDTLSTLVKSGLLDNEMKELREKLRETDYRDATDDELSELLNKVMIALKNGEDKIVLDYSEMKRSKKKSQKENIISSENWHHLFNDGSSINLINHHN